MLPMETFIIVQQPFLLLTLQVVFSCPKNRSACKIEVTVSDLNSVQFNTVLKLKTASAQSVCETLTRHRPKVFSLSGPHAT